EGGGGGGVGIGAGRDGGGGDVVVARAIFGGGVEGGAGERAAVRGGVSGARASVQGAIRGGEAADAEGGFCRLGEALAATTEGGGRGAVCGGSGDASAGRAGARR